KVGPIFHCHWYPIVITQPSTMPHNKESNEEKSPLITGKFGTSLKNGTLKLPNVGKSTFFNAFNSQALAVNVPFCTTESRVHAPNEIFDFLCHHKPLSKTPAFLNAVDIASLVTVTHNEQEMGNAFLSHIHVCNGIIHVAHVFENEIIHVQVKHKHAPLGKRRLPKLQERATQILNNDSL
ncbi:Obg-like ATPase 1, partial [Galemys pyrenaicus]